MSHENLGAENKESPLLSKSIPLKHEETNASDGVVSQQQNMLENFLVMLLHFCKRELQNQPASASHQEKFTLPPLLGSESTSGKMENLNYIMVTKYYKHCSNLIEI